MRHTTLNEVIYRMPVFGNGADILAGAFVMRGATPGTNNGELIKASGASALPDILGQLQELHDYSVTGDNLLAGTNFVTHPVLLAHPFRIFRLRYAASGITCTQAVSTTTMTVTSLEDNIDAAFLYVQSGTGIGQTNYLTASASGACTLKAAFGTSLDTSSTFIKIIPRFNQLISLNTDGTQLASQDAAGAVNAIVLDSYIVRNNREEQLNPVKHAALTGLNSLRSIRFEADIAFIDAIPYSIA